jgi:hypothetical protein
MGDVYRHASGATVGGGDRHTMFYNYQGRRWEVPVDREDTYYINVVKGQTWTDGTPMTPTEIEFAVSVLREACAAWGIPCNIGRFDLKEST